MWDNVAQALARAAPLLAVEDSHRHAPTQQPNTSNYIVASVSCLMALIGCEPFDQMSLHFACLRQCFKCMPNKCCVSRKGSYISRKKRLSMLCDIFWCKECCVKSEVFALRLRTAGVCHACHAGLHKSKAPKLRQCSLTGLKVSARNVFRSFSQIQSRV